MKTQLKRTLQIALPLIVANLVQILMGIIDAAMVGAIHSDLLAASALVNSVVTIPFVLGMGLTMAVAPLIATGIGRNDHNEPVSIIFNSVLICGGFGLILALGFAFFSDFIFYLGQEKTVAMLAKPYLQIIGWSLLPMILFLCIKQFADGMEETRLPMIISLYTIPVNIILNYVLIYGKFGFPRMELDGAGVATLITRVLLLVAMVYLLLKHKRMGVYFSEWRSHLRPNKFIIKRILSIGIPSSMQYGLETWAFSVSGIMVGWLGATALAAHQIALSLASFTFVIALGLSGAGAIRVGNNYGRGDWPMVYAIGKGVILLAVGLGTVSAFAFVIFREPLALIFNKETEVITLAATLLILAAMFQISDSVQAIGVGLLRGLQDVRVPTIFVAIAYWVIGIPGGYLMAFHFEMGVIGIWLGFLLGLTSSAILLTYRFFRTSRKHLDEVLS